MKKKICGLAVLVGSFLMLTSCGDTWLEPVQPSGLNPDNAYSTYDGCMGLVTKLCAELRPEVMGRSTNMRWSLEGSDLAALVNGNPRDYNTMMVPSIGGKIQDFWDDTYKNITRAAMLVSRSETMDGTESEKAEIRAYGEFFLGYWYYRMITTYGNIPLITEEISAPKLDFRTSSCQRIISKMIPMLEDAVSSLPSSCDAGEISKAAAQMVLTKYYLMNGDFQLAADTASDIIGTPGLSLMKSRFGALVTTPNAKIPNPNVMTDLFYKYNASLPENTEKILVVLDDASAVGSSSSGSEKMREYLVEWYNGQYDTAQTDQTQSRTKGIGVRSTIDGATGGPGPFDFSSNAAENLQILWTGRGIGASKQTDYFAKRIWDGADFNGDMRHSQPNWYHMEDLVYNVKTSKLYGQHLVKENCSDTLRCWGEIVYNKVVVDEENRLSNDYNMLGGAQDWYIFRLAEAYLLRAEALVWLGKGDEAAADISVIRKRAGAKEFSGTATLDDVLDERARELYLEEFRRSELVRIAYTKAKLGQDGYSLENIGVKNWFYDRMSKKNNLFFDITTGETGYLSYGNNGNNVQIYRMSPYHIYWPIPESAINDNTLAVLNQNYGYVGYENNIEPIESDEE